MGRVAVVTDSTSCLSPELVQQYGIHVVPLNIHFGDTVYRDGVNLQPPQFYELLRKGKQLPTTSTPSAGDFLTAYQGLASRADGIVAILISAVYSTASDEARVARDMLRESLPEMDIEVVDSRTTGGALGLVALKAARTAAQGTGVPEVAARAIELIPRVTFIAALDTLSYLARGGRIGTAAAWAGSMLRTKPLIEVSTKTGNTEALEQARTKRRAVERLLEISEERLGRAPVHAMVHHAGAPRAGEALRAEVAARFNCVELYLTPFTPVMGAHTGPGTLGISFFQDS